MKKKLIIAAVAAAILAAVGGSLFYMAYYDRKQANFLLRHEFYVYPSQSSHDVVSELESLGIVRNVRSFRRCMKDVTPSPGHYTISPENSSMYVSRMLSLGWQSPVNLVLSGTMRSKGTIAKKIASQMLADSMSVAQALDNQALLDSLGMKSDFLMAYVIPDTYEVYWTETPAQIIARLKKEYDAFWTDSRRELARSQGLGLLDASVLASIVSGETNYEPEMPSVAAVYLNRLHRGMKLQADPTVAYCFDYKLSRILNVHLQVDSPYNTYKYAGLPPAPICVPSKSALKAVLSPSSHDYLFFCASPTFDGTHRFAATYSQHLKNAREFQSELTKRQREKAAAD